MHLASSVDLLGSYRYEGQLPYTIGCLGVLPKVLNHFFVKRLQTQYSSS